MVYRIDFTPEAKQELAHELSYSRRHWGSKHAADYRRAITSLIRQIAENPLRHAIKPTYGAGVRTLRYKGNYIVYRVIEAEKIVQIIGFPAVSRDVRYDK
jgi:plasmid stabilization system protein ParE